MEVLYQLSYEGTTREPSATGALSVGDLMGGAGFEPA